MCAAYVYIVTNKRNGTLYIGSTSSLINRIWEHKNKLREGFTSKYDLNLLVYFEECSNILEAAQRERQLKTWRRQWKIELIETKNPRWKDLFEQITH